MRRSRPVLVAMLAVAAGALLVLSPATAAGPGGWDHVGSGAASGSASLNSRVSALAPGDGALLVGGAFTDAGGRANGDRVAEWNGQTWSALGAAPLPNGEVKAIAYDNGKTYVGGSFVNAGGNAEADYLAVWDGATWEPFCDSLTPPTFNFNVDALQIIGSTLFVGGEFQDAADIDTADYMLACDLTTGASSSLFATDGQFSGPIYSLAADSLGTLYAGGNFLNLAEFPGADYVAGYSGGTWHAVGPSGTPSVTGIVRSLDTEGTNLYVGTDALDIAGIPQADHVARWDGSAWSALGANTAGTNGWLPASATIYALESYDGVVMVGGAFLDANGQAAADYLAAFGGTTWRPIGSNGSGDGPVGAEVHALRVYGNQLFAGGNFTAAGGDSRAKFLATYPLSVVDNAISKKAGSGYAGNDVYDDGRGQEPHGQDPQGSLGPRLHQGPERRSDVRRVPRERRRRPLGDQGPLLPAEHGSRHHRRRTLRQLLHRRRRRERLDRDPDARRRGQEQPGQRHHPGHLQPDRGRRARHRAGRGHDPQVRVRPARRAES